jgi:uncharacterized SAM-binding protein YcdF (DUF218 family)
MNEHVRRNGEQGGALVNLIGLLCIAAFFFLIYLVRHPLMRYTAEYWVIDEPAQRADAVIVLGDDNFYADRATRAAELSRQQVAPVVVASGRRLRPSAGIAELMEHDLVERGVPKDKVARFAHDSSDTIGEAEALANLAKEKHWSSVIIVTSNYHARRVRYIFEKVFPPEIAVSVAGARDGDFDPERWWEKRKATALFGHEILGMVEAFWELHGRQRSPGVAALLWLNSVQGTVPDVNLKSTQAWKKFACALHTVSAVLCLRF